MPWISQRDHYNDGFLNTLDDAISRVGSVDSHISVRICSRAGNEAVWMRLRRPHTLLCGGMRLRIHQNPDAPFPQKIGWTITDLLNALMDDGSPRNVFNLVDPKYRSSHEIIKRRYDEETNVRKRQTPFQPHINNPR